MEIEMSSFKRYLPEELGTDEMSDWRKFKTSHDAHSGRFEYLLQSELWTDVTFVVGQVKLEYKAHKLVLRTGSKVFDNLFHEYSQVNSFEIPDVEPPEFVLFLKVYLVDLTTYLSVKHDNSKIFKKLCFIFVSTFTLVSTLICRSTDQQFLMLPQSTKSWTWLKSV